MGLINLIFICAAAVFIPIFVWILFVFIKYIKKNRNLYKSTFTQIFKSKLSISLILIFYATTFGLVGGMSTFLSKISEGMQKSYITQKSATSYSKELKINTSSLTDDNYIQMGLKPALDFVTAVDNEFGVNWWVNHGQPYFQTEYKLAEYLIYTNYYKNYATANSEVIFDHQIQWIFEPEVSESQRTSFAFVGANFYDPFTQTSSNIYDGKDNSLVNYKKGEYILNNPIVYEGNLENLKYDSFNPFIQIGIQKEFADAKGYKVGDIIQMDLKVFQVGAIVNLPNWIYPVHNPTNAIVDKNNQSTVLIDNQKLIEISDSNREFIMNYGYTDVYDSVSSFRDFNLGKKQHNNVKNRRNKFEIFLNENFLNQQNSGKHSIVGEVVSLESLRISFGLFFIRTNETFLMILLFAFMLIILVVISLLIKKRVKDSAKQLGTLKAMGVESSEISVAYIIFPIIITVLGGLLAILFSMWIQGVVLGTATQFLSFPTGTYLVASFAYMTVLVIPLLFLTALGFLIARRILNKPALDLLTNKLSYTPNKAVRFIGYITPSFIGFSTSYKVKGMFRAVGKSALLGFALFGGTALTSLSMSTSTMFDSFIASANKKIDFDTAFLMDSNPYSKIIDSEIESHLIKKEITFNLLDKQGEGDFAVNEAKYIEYQNILETDGYIKASDWLVHEVNTWISTNGKELIEQDSLGYKANYYLPFEQAALIFINTIELSIHSLPSGGTLLEKDFIGTSTFGEAFSAVAPSIISSMQRALISGVSIREITDSFISLEGTNINLTPNNFIKLMKPYGVDITFGDLYVSSKNESLVSSTTMFYDDSYSSRDTRIFNIFSNVNQITNAFNIGQENINNLKNYSGDKIPVIIFSELPNWIEKFNLSTGTNTFKSNTQYKSISPLSHNYVKHNIELEYEIVGSYNSPIPLGTITHQDAYNNYINDKIGSGPPSVIDWDYKTLSEGLDLNKQSVTLNVGNKNLYNATKGIPILFDQAISFGAKHGMLQKFEINSSFIYSQAEMIYKVVNKTFSTISFYAMFIGLGLVVIAIKEIVDSARREVAMLKALGYSNFKSTSLVLSPYIFIALISFGLAIPLTLLGLNILGLYLTTVTGTAFIFTLTTTQLLVMISIIVGLIITLQAIAYKVFSNTNPLEALSETED